VRMASFWLFLSNENPISSRSGLRFLLGKVLMILETSSEGSPAPSNRAKRECCPFRSLRSSCAISIGSSGGYSNGSFIVDLQPRQEIPLLAGLLKKHEKERFLRCVHDLTMQFIRKNVVCSMSNHELRYEMTRISTLSTVAYARDAFLFMVFSERLVSLRLFQHPQPPVPLRLGSRTWDRRAVKSLLS